MALLLAGCDLMDPEPLEVAEPDAPAATAPGTAPGPTGSFAFAPVPEYAFDVAAEAGVERRCVAHVMTAKLLTRNGNPAITVSIDGVPGPAFLVPTEAVLGVYHTARLRLPARGRINVGTIAGEGSVPVVEAARLQVEQGFAHDVQGIDLGAPVVPRVAKQLPLGVLGYDVLGGYDMLLDMPRQRVMLFRPSGEPNCPRLADWIPGGHRADLRIGADNDRTEVHVRLNGHLVRMAVEPAANVSVIGREDAEAAGFEPGGSVMDDTVRTEASSVMLGTRHRFHTVGIGDWQGSNFSVDIEPARYAALGLNFFRHRKVILGLRDAEMVFGDEHPDELPPDTTRPEPGPISTRVAETAVYNGPPLPGTLGTSALKVIPMGVSLPGLSSTGGGVPGRD
ncbi:MAG: retroviral-like aspartic protease family protein [Gluconacetobacter diazotrophicus]|nr:retroviral-like aspartic protease family protein [Gluconacetobacter diazotrophicus]